MIAGVKKIPLLRYGLIVLLIVVLFGSAFFLYLHYNKAEKIRTSFQQMINARENSALIDSCIVELYSADNSSRMYALTFKKEYFTQFNRQIKNVHNIIDTINRNNKTTASLAEDTELGDLISEKSLKTDSYIKLMTLTDSLLKSAKKLNRSLKDKDNKYLQQPVVRHVKTEVRIDTIRPLPKVATAPAPKKSFFKRLFGKKEKEAEARLPPVLVQRTTDTTITTMTPTPKVARVYNSYYSKLYEANNKLRINEREMLEINNRLISQIIGSLKKYKVAEQQYIAASKTQVNSNLSNVLYEFKRLSGLMFLMLTIVVVVILYNIWKIFKNEKEMVVYTEMAENYALSKSRFMASMSHEIRTPLNSIIGFSEQLTQSQLTETQVEQTNAIRSSSKMLLDVVNEILDFSKYETGKMNFEVAPFKPHEAIADIVTSMQVQAGKKGIELSHQLDFGSELCLQGDYFRLKTVVMNLVSNAIKFTPRGSVFINAFITDGRQPGFKVLNVHIRDTGLGIDKEHLPFIFDEFSQVNSAQKATNTPGTGLGLAIVKKIVELQGGSVKVTSKVGKGSIFSFKLPMEVSADEACEFKETIVETDPRELVAGKHALVAEDNKLNVLLVSTILKKWGITFDVAYDGRDALQLFEDHPYDIILTDIEMPEMGGIEFSQVVRANGNPEKASLPILALTANVLKEDRDKYFAVGMTGVVLKPFSERNLIDSIAAALSNRNMLVN
ncbi:response regulator [Mucilaginibacter sp. ZT4R22]|uniref:histidine kinase n=1 Tax=Mucilaginibacter pankratovii TaxID=2772110 RepID=A0ABR7WVC9_9SPHI|nr:ATP-binding protein [Mucilaginibacter pankratovii]MBD1366254.1 response regulator [Mucilaginibacter pankratovii]